MVPTPQEPEFEIQWGYDFDQSVFTQGSIAHDEAKRRKAASTRPGEAGVQNENDWINYWGTLTAGCLDDTVEYWENQCQSYCAFMGIDTYYEECLLPMRSKETNYCVSRNSNEFEVVTECSF